MEKSWKERNKELAVLWKNHIEQWSKTSLSQIDYCRQHNLSHNRFTYWKVKFKKKNLPIEFVQIQNEPMSMGFSCLKLNIASGLQLEIPDGFSRTTLEKVLMTLKVL